MKLVMKNITTSLRKSVLLMQYHKDVVEKVV
jgi:hypothetical protein